MSIVVLHLSDIHVRSISDPIINRASAIAATVNSQAAAASLIVVAVTGDIAFSGKDDQYLAAELFLDEIRTLIAKETDGDVRVVVVPGNHDCDFDLCNETRRNNIAAMLSKQHPSVDESVILTCTTVQEAFFKFRDGIENWEQVSGDRLWRSLSTTVEGTILRIDALNVSWVSNLKEQKNLFFPIERYQAKLDEKADIRLTLMHHPLNWYHQNKYRELRNSLRKMSSAILTGHEHEGSVGLIDEADTDKSAFVEGWVLQHDNLDLSETGLNVITIDVQRRQFNCISHKYVKGRYEPSSNGTWEEFHDLPSVTQPELCLQQRFIKTLRDPGALFGSHGESLTLGDVFVYPDLRRMEVNPGAKRKFLNAKSLREPDVIKGGVIVEGDDRTGCTSLLRQLYESYLDLGFCPVLINGSDITHWNDREIDSQIKRALKNQYEENSLLAASQTQKARKVLLVDDFDECSMADASTRAQVVKALRARFDYMVIAVSKLFEVKEMLERDATKELASLPHYQLQLFGFKKRGELIDRWLSLEATPAQSEATFIAKYDQAERLINAAMDKSIIPAAPLYLLALLQSLDVGSSSELKESALGHYYHFLLTQALTTAGVPNTKLNELFDYVSRLAWHFHTAGQSELTHAELRAFNTQYVETWNTVDFESRLAVLLKARILFNVSDSYEFRYPYMYYYLKGMHLSSILNTEDARAYVMRCCNHLYVRDYANTVLFLAHHTKDEWLLASISESLQGLFEGVKELKFDEDTASIVQLIADAPKLVYQEKDPRQVRAERNESKDEVEANDGLLEVEQKPEQLTLAAQLAMLFKNIEILGQVLKNQYSGIMRTQKRELIKQLFSGPLRALGSFYSHYEKNPEEFVDQVSQLMKRRGQTEAGKNAARRMVANLFLGITFGIIHRGSKSVNSEELLEDVHWAVQKDGSTAFRLMELAVLLDSAKDLPRRHMKDILDHSSGNMLVELLLVVMVLNRLYMFKTSPSDMNWLKENMKMGLELQHQIAYQNSGRQLN